MANQTPFNVAIIGAGIGGLALAIGLTHLEVPFTLYESAAAFSAVGAGIGLGPNALNAMDLIDKRFRDQYVSIAIGNATPGKKHVMMEAMRLEAGLGEGEDWWGTGGWGTDYFERTAAHRKDLLEIMASFVDSNAIQFGKRVTEITEHAGEVILSFHDGSSVRHAAVIGSDGVRGLARQAVLAEKYPEHVEPKYTGTYVYRAVVPMQDGLEIMGSHASDAKMFMSKGVNIAFYTISGGAALNLGAFVRDTEPWTSSEGTQTVSRQQMLDDFLGNNPDARIMKLLQYPEPVRWAIFHHPDTPVYFRSLICMMGDVAHASAPHAGAAAGQCLEDALILSRVLGRFYSSSARSTLSTASPQRTQLIEAAFRAYDEVRRPRAQLQVQRSQEIGNIYTFSHPVVGDDIVAAVHELNGRFAWLWEHDLTADIKQVESTFDELVRDISPQTDT